MAKTREIPKVRNTVTVHNLTNRPISISIPVTASDWGRTVRISPYGSTEVDIDLIILGREHFDRAKREGLIDFDSTATVGPPGPTGPPGPPGPTMIIKSGIVLAGSFSGNPQKSTITFDSSFANDNYSITITGADARLWEYESKTSMGFVINSNASSPLSNEVSWQTIYAGEIE